MGRMMPMAVLLTVLTAAPLALAQSSGDGPAAADKNHDKDQHKRKDPGASAINNLSANVGIANGPDGLGTVGAGIGGIGGAAGIIEQGPGKAGVGAPPGEGSAK
jgi:hypothetical protein